MAEDKHDPDGVIKHIEAVAELTKSEALQEVANKQREFNEKWGTIPKRGK